MSLFSMPLKLKANQLGNVFIFTYQCCRQIKLSFVLASVACWYHWPNTNLGVLLCRKEQEQFKSPLGNFHCLHSCSLSWHWLLILALLLTSVWLEGYRNLATCMIFLICKMQLIYLLWQWTEFLIIPGNSNYLNYWKQFATNLEIRHGLYKMSLYVTYRYCHNIRTG